MATIPPANRKLMDRRAQLLGPAYRLFYETPLHLVRGEGVWLFDDQGQRYLDMMSAYSAVSFGHSHPLLVKALTEQAGH